MEVYLGFKAKGLMQYTNFTLIFLLGNFFLNNKIVYTNMWLNKNNR